MWSFLIIHPATHVRQTPTSSVYQLCYPDRLFGSPA